MIVGTDPPKKSSRPGRAPPYWAILIILAFLLLIWTVLRFIAAIQELDAL